MESINFTVVIKTILHCACSGLFAILEYSLHHKVQVYIFTFRNSLRSNYQILQTVKKQSSRDSHRLVLWDYLWRQYRWTITNNTIIVHFKTYRPRHKVRMTREANNLRKVSTTGIVKLESLTNCVRLVFLCEKIHPFNISTFQENGSYFSFHLNCVS